MTTITITRRTRNLGFAGSNTLVQHHNHTNGTSQLVIQRPTQPQFVGGPRTIRDALTDWGRVNTGNESITVLFVGGQPVLEWPGRVLRDLDVFGSATVTVAPDDEATA